MPVTRGGNGDIVLRLFLISYSQLMSSVKLSVGELVAYSRTRLRASGDTNKIPVYHPIDEAAAAAAAAVTNPRLPADISFFGVCL